MPGRHRIAPVLQTFRHDGGIHELHLDRPPANALDPELIAALRAAVAAAPAEGARALVLSGAPGMFSAGLDVPALLPLDRAAIRAVWLDFYALLRGLAESALPVAAAITGHSPAGGAVLALFCDHRVQAAGDFRIGLNEVQVGIALPPVLHRALARQVGARQAERLAVGGLMLRPEEALAVGLVDEVVAPEGVVAAALAWCRDLLARPAGAMAATRRLARADLAALFGSPAEAAEIDGLVEGWFSAETQATLRALVERLRRR
jgi:enoyl-CoA hydratase/carnithine racemase